MSENPKAGLVFPCDFPLRVIGKDEDNFFEFVVDLVAKHFPGIPEENFTIHSSSGGKYLSVSVNFWAESREKVDALYIEMGQHKRILLAL